MTPEKNGNGKKEIRNLERRLNDEKLGNLEDKLDTHEIRIKNSEDIVGGWKTERRSFMYAISALNGFIGIVLMAILFNVSAIKTEMSKHNESQARETGKIKGEIGIVTTNINNLEKNTNTKIENLKDKINIFNELNIIKDKLK